MLPFLTTVCPPAQKFRSSETGFFNMPITSLCLTGLDKSASSVWWNHLHMDQKLRNVSSTFFNLGHKGLRKRRQFSSLGWPDDPNSIRLIQMSVFESTPRPFTVCVSSPGPSSNFPTFSLESYQKAKKPQKHIFLKKNNAVQIPKGVQLITSKPKSGW